MELSAIKFPYQTDVVSEKLYENHIKLYQGYINKTNEIFLTHKKLSETDLSTANAIYSPYRGLKSSESFAVDGVVLHELFFQNLVKEDAQIGKNTKSLLESSWGSIENWKASFVASAKCARGWCVLAFEPRTGNCLNIIQDSHSDGVICGAIPLLVLDVYEHAFMLDFGGDKPGYINKFMENIPWGIVEKRAESVVR